MKNPLYYDLATFFKKNENFWIAIFGDRPIAQFFRILTLDVHKFYRDIKWKVYLKQNKWINPKVFK